MAISIFFRPVVLLAGGLGVLQGVLWISLTIVGLCSYFCVLNIKGDHTVGSTLHLNYFMGKDCTTGITVDNDNWSQTLNIWTWLYMVFSAFWVISSIFLLKDVTLKKLKYANYFLYAWIFLTLGISIMDFALGVILGVHYSEINDNIVVATAVGVLMTIALRGFLLWIINITCAIYLMVCTLSIAEHNNNERGNDNLGYHTSPHSIHRERPIDAFSPSPTIAKQPPWSNNSPLSSRVPPWERGSRSPHVEPLPVNRVGSQRDYRSSEPYNSKPDYGYNDNLEIRRSPENLRRSAPRPPVSSRPRTIPVPPVYPNLPPPAKEPRPDYSPVLPKLKPALKNRDSNNQGDRRMY